MEQSNFSMEQSDWLWSELTFGWREVTGGKMIMGQNDRKPFSWFTDEAGV